MNAHQLDANGVIINTIVVEALSVFPRLVDAAIGGSIGDSIIHGALVPKGAGTQTPIVPAEISRRQALQALYLRTPSIAVADIEAAIIAHTSGAAQGLALIELRESQVFERARPLVGSIGAVLGLSPADMDALFIQAAAL